MPSSKAWTSRKSSISFVKSKMKSEIVGRPLRQPDENRPIANAHIGQWAAPGGWRESVAPQTDISISLLVRSFLLHTCRPPARLSPVNAVPHRQLHHVRGHDPWVRFAVASNKPSLSRSVSSRRLPKEAAEQLPPGTQRELLVKRVRQAEDCRANQRMVGHTRSRAALCTRATDGKSGCFS